MLSKFTVQLLYQAGFYGAPVDNANAVSWTTLDQSSGSKIYSLIGPYYYLNGTYNWSYIPSYPQAPQYIGVTYCIYNIYSSPILI